MQSCFRNFAFSQFFAVLTYSGIARTNTNRNLPQVYLSHTLGLSGLLTFCFHYSSFAMTRVLAGDEELAMTEIVGKRPLTAKFALPSQGRRNLFVRCGHDRLGCTWFLTQPYVSIVRHVPTKLLKEMRKPKITALCCTPSIHLPLKSNSLIMHGQY